MQNLKEILKNDYLLELGNKFNQELISLEMTIEDLNYQVWPIHKNLKDVSEINIGYDTKDKDEIIKAYNILKNKFEINTPNITDIITGVTITFSDYYKQDDSAIIFTTHDKVSSMSNRFEIRLTLMKY